MAVLIQSAEGVFENITYLQTPKSELLWKVTFATQVPHSYCIFGTSYYIMFRMQWKSFNS